MNLFIDSISTPAYICLFDEKRNITHHTYIDIKGNESSKLIPELTDFLDNNKVKNQDLENIVIVNGPGSFTGVRTVVLIANTLNYVIKKNMTALSYFDLFHSYPIIKSSSRRDHFIQKNIDTPVEIINNTELESYFNENNIETVYGETGYRFENVEILENIDYNCIINQLELQKHEKIEPLYIKKPNIS